MRGLWTLIFGEGWLATLATYVTITTAILIVGPLMMMLFTWIERRGIAYMQDRKGPNRVGPFGLFQPLAEAIKTMTKEDITPRGADRWVHLLAPVVIMFSTVMAFAVIPWGNLMPPTADMNVAVLFVVAVSAIHTLGLLMAGWGSNNKFALLGGMRGVAQAISYEIPQVMSLVAIVLMAGTMSVKQIVLNQTMNFGLGWYVFNPVGLFAFLIFWIAALAEGERTPFDIPEAESEIVAGHMTEYSGMKFAVFYLANYMTNLAICALAAGLFLGGGAGPGTTLAYIGTPLSVIYFLIKTIGLFFVMVWLRGTLPRLRVDQLMAFAWKFLLPLALINTFSAAIWVAITQWGAPQNLPQLDQLTPALRLVIAYVVTGALNIGAFLWMVRAGARRRVALPGTVGAA
ncbi:NADH-quinone oxidoreductase subunit NuoH [Kallotenue papyrolyticum]|uniref:NADH-quinone oxidoreductase subunit NuoH n=1 Tax=Kallotenue papyrolyticum TaxID=1325125 RepID=UPI00047864FD|nr:NADH-quinone oxidoreductase subunit NuoH [Kallotenue papyrolyticum]